MPAIALLMLSATLATTSPDLSPPAPHAPSESPALVPPLTPPADVMAPKKIWYGWELLLSDTASLVLMSRGGGGPVSVAGALGLTLGAPTLHFVNHHVGAGVASLLVRGAVAGLAYGIASGWGDCSNVPGGPRPGCAATDPSQATADSYLYGGLILGGLVFAVIDDTVFASRTVMQPASSAAVVPTVGASAGGLQVGMVGRF
jgi:hypothetical protein